MFDIPVDGPVNVFCVIIMVLLRMWAFQSWCWWKDTILSIITWFEKQLQQRLFELEKKMERQTKQCQFVLWSHWWQRDDGTYIGILWFDWTIDIGWRFIWLGDCWKIEFKFATRGCLYCQSWYYRRSFSGCFSYMCSWGRQYMFHFRSGWVLLLHNNNLWGVLKSCPCGI
jgi:hypothetical protein